MPTTNLRRNPPPAASVLAHGIHDLQPAVLDSELRGRVNGYAYEEYREARGYADCQETRRAWRAGR